LGGFCASVRTYLAYPPEKLGECDAARCKAAGGACGYAGMACPRACIRRTTDGGKPCSDSSECQSACTTKENIPAGQKARGTCHELALVLGCSRPVRQGLSDSFMCSD